MEKYPLIDIELENEFMKSLTHQIRILSRTMRGQFLAPENSLKFTHGRLWENPANDVGDKSGKMELHSSEVSISFEEIISGDTTKIFSTARTVSESMNEAFTKTMIETMKASTEKSGNVFDAKGKPAHEAFYEVIEKLELPIDENGELSMPSVFVGPGGDERILKSLNEAGPEFEKNSQN